MKHLWRIVVGIVAAALIGTIVLAVGGPVQIGGGPAAPAGGIISSLVSSFVAAMLFFLLSIVCTAGAGLLVWLPVWWLLGWASLSLLARISGASRDRLTTGGDAGKPVESAAPTRRERELAVLAQYITRAKSGGLQVDAIQSRLRDAGWDAELIKRAQQIVALQKNST